MHVKKRALPNASVFFNVSLKWISWLSCISFAKRYNVNRSNQCSFGKWGKGVGWIWGRGKVTAGSCSSKLTRNVTLLLDSHSGPWPPHRSARGSGFSSSVFLFAFSHSTRNTTFEVFHGKSSCPSSRRTDTLWTSTARKSGPRPWSFWRWVSGCIDCSGTARPSATWTAARCAWTTRRALASSRSCVHSVTWWSGRSVWSDVSRVYQPSDRRFPAEKL